MRTLTPLLYERFEYESECKCGANNVRIRKDETPASSQSWQKFLKIKTENTRR